MTEKRYDIAVVGATGLVGEAIIELLADRDFPVGDLYPLAGSRSAGSRIQFRGKNILVGELADFDFTKVQIAFFAADAEVAGEYAPKAAGAGCVVIDNSSEFRDDDDVPLVVAEANPDEIGQYNQSYIIANPNCSTIQMVVALKPIYDAVGIERVNAVTFHAVSGSGRKGVNELAGQTAALLNAKPATAKVYPKQIAFNLLPQVGVSEESGYTREELGMAQEMQKVFGDSGLKVNATAVQVPVFFGHAATLHVETGNRITAEQARELLGKAAGVELAEEGDCPTPVTDAVGQDAVCVGRIREDISHHKGLDLWVVADNVRKGAALNSVQIAEILIKDYLS